MADVKMMPMAKSNNAHDSLNAQESSTFSMKSPHKSQTGIGGSPAQTCFHLPLLFDRSSGSWWNPRFDSTILENKLLHSYFPQTRMRFRFALVFSILAAALWCVYFGVRQEADFITYIVASATLVVVAATLLGITFTSLYSKLYIFLSIFYTILLCCLLLSAQFVYKTADITIVGSFCAYIGLLLLLYTVVPMPLYVSIIIGLLLTIAYEVLLIVKITYMDGPEMIAGRIILHLCIHVVGIHVSFMSQVQRHSTFMKIGQAAIARRGLQIERQIREKMIHSLMPPSVAKEVMQAKEDQGGKADDEGASNKKRGSDGDNKGEIVFRSFQMNQMQDVSILFADIVGFTKMSSNKTAEHLVGLLNDLFGRFDNLCIMTGCEKISTLGDCYYCVSGCPEPKADHAKCCVEMGLKMIEAINQFDIDNNEQVDMRVGVHTGTVLCGIVGTRRFKFDVWSNDVTLANIMESSGQPGRVHISEKSYNFLKDDYEVEEGEECVDNSTYKVLIEHYDTETSMFAVRHTEEQKTIKTYFILGPKMPTLSIMGSGGVEVPLGDQPEISDQTALMTKESTIREDTEGGLNHLDNKLEPSKSKTTKSSATKASISGTHIPQTRKSKHKVKQKHKSKNDLNKDKGNDKHHRNEGKPPKDQNQGGTKKHQKNDKLKNKNRNGKKIHDQNQHPDENPLGQNSHEENDNENYPTFEADEKGQEIQSNINHNSRSLNSNHRQYHIHRSVHSRFHSRVYFTHIEHHRIENHYPSVQNFCSNLEHFRNNLSVRNVPQNHCVNRHESGLCNCSVHIEIGRPNVRNRRSILQNHIEIDDYSLRNFRSHKSEKYPVSRIKASVYNVLPENCDIERNNRSVCNLGSVPENCPSDWNKPSVCNLCGYSEYLVAEHISVETNIPINRNQSSLPGDDPDEKAGTNSPNEKAGTNSLNEKAGTNSPSKRSHSYHHKRDRRQSTGLSTGPSTTTRSSHLEVGTPTPGSINPSLQHSRSRSLHVNGSRSRRRDNSSIDVRKRISKRGRSMRRSSDHVRRNSLANQDGSHPETQPIKTPSSGVRIILSNGVSELVIDDGSNPTSNQGSNLDTRHTEGHRGSVSNPRTPPGISKGSSPAMSNLSDPDFRASHRPSRRSNKSIRSNRSKQSSKSRSRVMEKDGQDDPSSPPGIPKGSSPAMSNLSDPDFRASHRPSRRSNRSARSIKIQRSCKSRSRFAEKDGQTNINPHRTTRRTHRRKDDYLRVTKSRRRRKRTYGFGPWQITEVNGVSTAALFNRRHSQAFYASENSLDKIGEGPKTKLTTIASVDTEGASRFTSKIDATNALSAPSLVHTAMLGDGLGVGVVQTNQIVDSDSANRSNIPQNMSNSQNNVSNLPNNASNLQNNVSNSQNNVKHDNNMSQSDPSLSMSDELKNVNVNNQIISVVNEHFVNVNESSLSKSSLSSVKNKPIDKIKRNSGAVIETKFHEKSPPQSPFSKNNKVYAISYNQISETGLKLSNSNCVPLNDSLKICNEKDDKSGSKDSFSSIIPNRQTGRFPTDQSSPSVLHPHSGPIPSSATNHGILGHRRYDNPLALRRADHTDKGGSGLHSEESDILLVNYMDEDVQDTSYFYSAPLHRCLNVFTNNTEEDSFRRSYHKDTKTLTVTSPRFHALIEIVMSFIVFLLVAICCFVIFDRSVPFIIIFVIGFIVETLLIIHVVTDVKVPERKAQLCTSLMMVLDGWISRNVFGAALACLPTLLVFSNFSCDMFYTMSHFEDRMFCLCVLVSLLNFCNFTTLSSWMKISFVLTISVLLIVLLEVNVCSFFPDNRATTNDTNTTNISRFSWGYSTHADSKDALFTGNHPIHLEILLDIGLLLFILLFLSHTLEISHRVSYHGHFQAEKDRKRVQENRDQADWLLHNIIPKHVSEVVKRTSKYSKNHSHVGVIFATIVNFNDFYDESYAGGREYLRVLNELISDYEDLLDKPEFKDVEKIKTISSSFMAASGINEFNRSQNKHEYAHLFSLLDFCFELLNVNDRFNEGIFNFDFIMNIGFNFGDVTAGVIGTTKLHYDIWGDTVNIASRMYSTGMPNRIQVPETSYTLLGDMFEFEYRGLIFVKGKGDMKTYLVVKKKDDAHWE